MNSLEEATLSEGFDTLRMSMTRITTPPVVKSTEWDNQEDQNVVELAVNPPAPPLELKETAPNGPKARNACGKTHRRRKKPVIPLGNNQRDWATDSLPYIRVRKKSLGAAPYLTVIKHRKKKSTKLPELREHVHTE